MRAFDPKNIAAKLPAMMRDASGSDKNADEVID